MIYIVSRNCIRPEKREEFCAITAELVEKSRAEEGCVSYELVVERDDPNAFAFLEKWRDQAALDAHNQSEHFTRIVPQMRAMRQPEGSKTTIFGDL